MTIPNSPSPEEKARVRDLSTSVAWMEQQAGANLSAAQGLIGMPSATDHDIARAHALANVAMGWTHLAKLKLSGH